MRKTNKLFKFACLAAFAMMLLSSTGIAKASRIEELKDVNNTGDFDIGPTSFIINAKAGDTVNRTIQVTSRDGKKSDYFIEVEDFEGSKSDPSQSHMLLGKNKGNYGAKDWVTPEFTTFSLSHGQRLFFNVQIKIPDNADSGEHYFAVLISRKPVTDTTNANNQDKPNIVITSRVGSLFLVNVEGNVIQKGSLDSFVAQSNIFTKAPAKMQVVFKNEGTVHLEAKGEVQIKNLFGSIVETIPVESFNILRDSVRSREISTSTNPNKLLIGRYTASIKLERGYDGIVDTRELSFWYFPWREIAIVIGVLLAIIILVKLIRNNVSLSLNVKKKRRRRRQ